MTINTIIIGAITTMIMSGSSKILDLLISLKNWMFDEVYDKDEYVMKFDFIHDDINPTDTQRMFDNLLALAEKNNIDVKKYIRGRLNMTHKNMLFNPDGKFELEGVNVCIRYDDVKETVKGRKKPNRLASNRYDYDDDDYYDNDRSKTVSDIVRCYVTLNAKDRTVIDKLLKSCYDSIVKNNEDIKYIYQYRHKSGQNVTYMRTELKSLVTFDNLVLDQADMIKKRIDNVVNGKSERFTIMLHGAPGCGKTSTIKAILNYTGWSATKITLKDITDAELSDIFFNSKRYVLESGIYEPHKIANHVFILEEIDTGSKAVLTRKGKKGGPHRTVSRARGAYYDDYDDYDDDYDDYDDSYDDSYGNDDVGANNSEGSEGSNEGEGVASSKKAATNSKSKELLSLVNTLGVQNNVESSALEELNELIKKNSKKEGPASSLFKKEISLGGLLEILDGVIPLTGSVVIMTTNHYDKLDPALVRDGRINMTIELKPLTNEQYVTLVKKKFPDFTGPIPEKQQTPAKVANLLDISETVEQYNDLMAQSLLPAADKPKRSKSGKQKSTTCPPRIIDTTSSTQHVNAGDALEDFSDSEENILEVTEAKSDLVTSDDENNLLFMLDTNSVITSNTCSTDAAIIPTKSVTFSSNYLDEIDAVLA